MVSNFIYPFHRVTSCPEFFSQASFTEMYVLKLSQHSLILKNPPTLHPSKQDIVHCFNMVSECNNTGHSTLLLHGVRMSISITTISEQHLKSILVWNQVTLITKLIQLYFLGTWTHYLPSRFENPKLCSLTNGSFSHYHFRLL